MRKILSTLFALLGLSVSAQSTQDSLTLVRSILKKYPTVRPFNLEYDVNGGDHYQVRLQGNPLERGNVQRCNTVRFSATVPLLMKKRSYLIATPSFNGLAIRLTDIEGSKTPITERQMYSGIVGLTTMFIWRDSLAKRPLLLTTALVHRFDFGNKIYVINGLATATLSLKTTTTERLSVGVIYTGSTSTRIPLAPMLNYYKRLSSNWEFDAFIPSKITVRKQTSAGGDLPPILRPPED